MLVQRHGLQMETLHLRRGASVVLPVQDDGRLFLVDGEGGGSALELACPATVAWLPLAGHIQVRTPELSLAVRVREALVTEPVATLKAVAYANCRWFAAAGGRQAWDLLMMGAQACSSPPLPALYTVDGKFRRLVAALARCATPREIEARMGALVDEIIIRQLPLCDAIARTPGRTRNARLQAFLRLQRVRTYMAACCEKELDNQVLAGIANYSACHFVRTFKSVFQETPHAYLLRLRLRCAQRLLRAGGLAVTEVALASGFENRSTFSRSYRQRFGMTAIEAKRRGSGRGLQGAAFIP